MIRTISNDDELWEALEGLYAYDTGCVSSGIRDEVLRANAKEAMCAKSSADKRLFIGRKVREHILSDNALAEGYSVEDVASFWTWLDETMGCAL